MVFFCFRKFEKKLKTKFFYILKRDIQIWEDKKYQFLRKKYDFDLLYS